MGWLSAVAGAGAVVFGVMQVRLGFTELSMAFQVGLLPGFAWALAVAAFLYSQPEY